MGTRQYYSYSPANAYIGGKLTTDTSFLIDTTEAQLWEMVRLSDHRHYSRIDCLLHQESGRRTISPEVSRCRTLYTIYFILYPFYFYPINDPTIIVLVMEFGSNAGAAAAFFSYLGICLGYAMISCVCVLIFGVFALLPSFLSVLSC